MMLMVVRLESEILMMVVSLKYFFRKLVVF